MKFKVTVTIDNEKYTFYVPINHINPKECLEYLIWKTFRPNVIVVSDNKYWTGRFSRQLNGTVEIENKFGKIIGKEVYF